MAFEIKRNKRNQNKTKEKGKKTLSICFWPERPNQTFPPSLLSPYTDPTLGPSWPASGPAPSPPLSASAQVSRSPAKAATHLLAHQRSSPSLPLAANRARTSATHLPFLLLRRVVLEQDSVRRHQIPIGTGFAASKRV